MSDDLTSNSAGSDDWPARLTQTVVGYVDTVRSSTTGKVLDKSRLLVYVLAAGLIGMVAAVIFLVLLVRLLVSLTALLPVIDDGETWLAYLVLGAVFTGAGAFLWRRKGA